MKNHCRPYILLLITLIFPILSFGQVEFEEGYFINNKGEAINCLIKNYEWKNSPNSIEYKHSKVSEIETINISSIIEFHVSNFKYKRAKVEIDQSKKGINSLDDNRNPIFVEKTVFLRVFIEGKANLYFFGSKELYFFNVDESKITQLIYKNYLIKDKLTANYAFRAQLWNNMQCPNTTLVDIESLEYKEADLMQYFEKYNECSGSKFTKYEIRKKRDLFNLFINVGARLSTFSMNNSINQSQNVDFPNATNLIFGLDAEFIFPFNKNKWAFIIRPLYQSYYAKETRPNYNNTIDYKSIEISPGFKYYMFLSKSSKLYLSASLVIIDLPIKSSVGNLEIKSANNLNLGLGFIYKNRFSAEINYGSKRDLMSQYALYSSNYQTISFILGFNVF